MQIANLIVTIAITIILFLALRRIIWWYWGIDKHLANQLEIINKITAQIELQQTIANQEAVRRLAELQPELPPTSPQIPQSSSTQRRNPLTGK